MAPATDADVRHFISRQYVLLAREQEAEVERTSLLISNCSQKLLERKGLALGGLGVASVSIGLGGKSLVEFDRPAVYHISPVFPTHTLRPGDLARITEHAAGSAPTKKPQKTKDVASKDALKTGVKGVVYKVSDTRLVLAIDPSSSQEDLDIPERCCVIKLANTVTHERMKRAMEQVEHMFLPNDVQLPKTSGGRSPNSLQRVLMNIAQPSEPNRGDKLELFFDSKLNPSQIAAVKFALASPEVACIHGPPGTGKTRVLVEIIRQIVYSSIKNLSEDNATANQQPQLKSNLKVLVCGASNLAVDNLLERLCIPISVPQLPVQKDDTGSATKPQTQSDTAKHYPPIALTRLGHPARVMSSLYPRTLDFQSAESEEATLAKDVKAELEELLAALSGKSKKSNSLGLKTDNKGGKSTASRMAPKKGQRLKGEARREAWQNVKELRKEYRKREEGVVRSVLSKAQVVLATCHGAGSRQLQNMEFDVVIIDEATQAMEAVCWIPILKAKKLVLAGDPMQLGPTIISEGNRRHTKQGLKSSPEKNTPKAADSRQESSDADSSTGSTGSSSSSMPPNKSKGSDDRETSVSGIKITDIKSVSALRPSKSLGITLFDRLESMYGHKVKRMLEVQYRMGAKIASFPSKTLYQSRLQSYSANASGLLSDLPNVSGEKEYEDIVGPGTEVVFWDTAGAEFWERNEGDSGILVNGDDGGSLCDENEAEIVKRWVQGLLAAGVSPSQIAIITPYQAQCQLLTSSVGIPELEIGTVDGMQGRENEAVIISLVRSNPNGEVGFLKEKRRLNVAMTRAKKHLCVIGDSSTIRRGGGKYLKRWMDWLEKEADVRFAGDA